MQWNTSLNDDMLRVIVVMALEYVIYADESDEKGQYFSDFFGGVLIKSTELRAVIQALEETKEANNLHGELKWQKVTQNYLPKYMAFTDCFFEFIQNGDAKVRVMFTCNANVAVGLTNDHHRKKYTLLYYQFLKHAFGLQYSDDPGTKKVRFYLDDLPVSHEDRKEFRRHLANLNKNPGFRKAGIFVCEEEIADVNSKNHVVLQAIDIILGAMQFRLNDKHRIIPDGHRTRGKRTIAKERLYKHILSRVCEIRPNFNIGISTGCDQTQANRWHHPYRHWRFVPKNSTVDESKFK